MRSEFVTITVPADLITQVLQELLALSTDANHVDVTDGDNGRIILAHPELAEQWYQKVIAKSTEEDPVVAESTNGHKEVVASAITSEAPPAPVKRGPGRPPKSSYASYTTSASNGEEPT